MTRDGDNLVFIQTGYASGPVQQCLVQDAELSDSISACPMCRNTKNILRRSADFGCRATCMYACVPQTRCFLYTFCKASQRLCIMAAASLT